MDSAYVTGVLLRWVSPFGNLRIGAYLRLPAAYRSLSRPSSALSAKAFPLRSLQLDLFVGGSRYTPLRRAPKGFALWTPTIFSRKNRLKASSSPAGGTKVFGIRKLSSTLHCCNYINKNLENLGLFFLLIVVWSFDHISQQ